jgi:DNA mismatch repair protein MSH4
MQAETRYENARRYYLRFAGGEFDGRNIPDILVNRYRVKGFIECQTLDLMKLNKRIEDSHQEVVLMSDKTIQALTDDIRGEIPVLFRVCESIAMLDMITAFAHIATTASVPYSKPEISDCIVLQQLRHPVREKVAALNLHWRNGH